MPAVFVHQILNHYTSPQALDPGFLVLDNTGNERPDWYEYWPIRKFLLNELLDEDAYYGFLSPKFKLKTNLTAAGVHRFVGGAGGCDVLLFSPSVHNTAFYWNVFDHGEAEHPGLKAAADEFFRRIGQPTDLDALVSDSRTTVNANFFIAKPRFWRAWLAVAEALFVIAETPTDPLGVRLCAPVAYRGRVDVQLKIFLMERIATWLLTRDAAFATRARDPFAARTRIYKLPAALVCDALKIAYALEGHSQYRELFVLVSGLRKWLNWQVRLGGWLGAKRLRSALRALASHWTRTE